MRPTHRFLLLLGIAAGTLSLVAGTGPAGAHGGEAQLVVEEAEASRSGSVRYVVRLTYRADGHGVPDATLTAVGEEGDGSTAGPVPLVTTSEEGVYEGTVDFPTPGTWQVRFTSVTPAVTISQSQEIRIDPPGTRPPTTTTTTEPAATTASEPVTTPTTGDPSETAAPPSEEDGEDSSSAGPMAAAAVAGLTLVAGGTALVLRRRGANGG